MRKTCGNCESKLFCTFHKSNGYYRSKLDSNFGDLISKPFRVFDLEDREVKTVKMSRSERESNDYIELSRNIATCSSCRGFVECHVFTNFRHQDSVNFVICDRCFDEQEVTMDQVENILFRSKSRNGRDYR